MIIIMMIIIIIIMIMYNTIYDNNDDNNNNIYIYTYNVCEGKWGRPGARGLTGRLEKGSEKLSTYIYIQVYIYIHIYIYSKGLTECLDQYKGVPK